MIEAYKKTGLWQRSLGVKEDSDNREHLERLRSAYSIFRDRASQLTAQIAHALPNLTVHDVTHLDALWETADLIAGPNYPLNPLEGFVLGGAILLHDAALCYEAYDDGRDGLHQTSEWNDCYTAEKERTPLGAESDIEAAADFAALRSLHAKQAGDLVEKEWTVPDGGQIFLIDDYELRTRYGPTIGLIAASHHWTIEDVGSKLPEQVNAPNKFPREWRIDPVKIACLLRCADAAHIDSSRAPDYLYALLRRTGLSADHWQAQNWLARTDIDQSDTSGTSLLFTSNRKFGENDVNAWWVAYDAICLVDAEIRASNLLLGSRAQKKVSPQFKVARVSGASSPEAMSEHIRVGDWQPCSAKIHVGNVESLVESLGGENLYGDSDQISVALRELIQNARDAVAARRAWSDGFVGKISVRLRQTASRETYIEVEDDGLGMSERVLTGPLLDFGTSFWISNLVHEEFPGLRSSAFRSVGRFGIGFYSVFMIASAVTVSTRRWDAGLDDVRTLSFPNGLTLRPTLSKGRPEKYSAQTVTKVSCLLKEDLPDPSTIQIQRNRIGEENFHVAFADYLAVLVAGLDVSVEFQGPKDKIAAEVHRPISSLETPALRTEWLKNIAFASYTDMPDLKNKIETYVDRLRLLQDGEEICGLAALSTLPGNSTDFLSTQTIGGLATSVHGRSSTRFIGYLDYDAKSAKRSPTESIRVKPDVLKAWSDEQIQLLKDSKISPMEWCAATCNLCDMGLDPLSVGRVMIYLDSNFMIMNFSQVFELVKDRSLAIFKSSFMEHAGTHHTELEFQNYPTFRPLQNSGFLSLELTSGLPKNDTSFIGCLHRYAASQDCQLKFEKLSGGVLDSFAQPLQVLLTSVVDSN